MTSHPNSRTGFWNVVSEFAHRRADWIAVILVAGVVALIRIPFRFEWLGEQDQARFLVSSIAFRYEGLDIFPKYFLYTSPLAVSGFALIARVFGNDSLLAISNNVGVVAGIMTAVMVYFLSRTFSVGRLWSASIAVGSSLVPGVFMTALYGYPSVYALPFGIAAAAAVSRGVVCERVSTKLRWFVVATVAYAILMALKIDFALLGSSLLAVAVVHRRVTYVNVLLLLAVAVTALGMVLVCSSGLLSSLWRDAAHFGVRFNERHGPLTQVDTGLGTLWLSTGIGTLILLMLAFLNTFVREGVREGLRMVLAWLIAVGPIWVFWGSILPVSTRHAMPGSLFTAVFLGLIVARRFPTRRAVAFVFPALFVLSNWPWGDVPYDFNYYPSGNLVEACRVNRRAFGVCRRVTNEIVTSKRRVQILAGDHASDEWLGRIDIVPMIQYEFAARSTSVQTKGPFHRTKTRRADGSERVFLVLEDQRLAVFLRSTDYSARQITVNSLTGAKVLPPAKRGVEMKTFDLQRAYDYLESLP